MGLIFYDSFDYYTTLTDKWDFPFNAAIVNGVSRTGDQSLSFFGGNTGPAKNLQSQQIGTNYTKLIMGMAMKSDGFGGPFVDVMEFLIVAPAVQTQNCFLRIQSDGSLAVLRGPGSTITAVLGISAPGLFQFNSDWNYIEFKWFGDVANGLVEVRIAPPGQPMQVALTISGVRTTAFNSVPDAYCNQIRISSSGNLAQNNYIDDFYLVDWSNPALPNSDYLGGIKVYFTVPFANGSPVDWTPLAGSNWQNVSEVPPDGATSYNSTAAGGAIDQYQHNDNSVPANAQIKSVQHSMDLSLTAGVRAVTSVVEGVPHANSVYLPNGFSIYTYVYDLNPATGLPWVAADFPASFGPGVTV